MFGKFFASTFTGSMFGAGPNVFAVWGYVIANTVDSTVELNPQFLSAVIGAPSEDIANAITELCQPDPNSRTKDHEGRRLIHESAYQYRVVNHATYRQLRNEEDRRAYNRDAKRRQRSRDVKRVVIDKTGMSTMSAHTEAEAETEPETPARKDHSRGEEPRAPVRRPSRDGLVGRHQTTCDPSTWAACEAGKCVPRLIANEWRRQCEGAGLDADAEITATVTQGLSTAPPLLGDPMRFWRGVWSSRNPTPVSIAPTTTKTGRSLQAAKAAMARVK